MLRLTRRRCERALLAGSVMFGAWRLAKDHGETLVATGERDGRLFFF